MNQLSKLGDISRGRVAGNESVTTRRSGSSHLSNLGAAKHTPAAPLFSGERARLVSKLEALIAQMARTDDPDYLVQLDIEADNVRYQLDKIGQRGRPWPTSERVDP